MVAKLMLIDNNITQIYHALQLYICHYYRLCGVGVVDEH